MDSISDYDLGWLVGILEGEGSFSKTTYRQKNGRKNYAPLIRVAMTDRDIIESLVRVTGYSLVSGPYKNGTKQNGEDKKPYWVWKISNKKAETLMNKLKPFMGLRRQEQIAELFNTLPLLQQKENEEHQARQL